MSLLLNFMAGVRYSLPPRRSRSTQNFALAYRLKASILIRYTSTSCAKGPQGVDACF